MSDDTSPVARSGIPIHEGRYEMFLENNSYGDLEVSIRPLPSLVISNLPRRVLLYRPLFEERIWAWLHFHKTPSLDARIDAVAEKLVLEHMRAGWKAETEQERLTKLITRARTRHARTIEITK